MIEESIKAGGAGCLVGRNLSESSNVEKITEATAKIIFQGVSAEEAIKGLK